MRYPELLQDPMLPGPYALSSVMSHLGQPTAGHFVTHRVWTKGVPLVPRERGVPLLVDGKLQTWRREGRSSTGEKATTVRQ